MFTVDMQSRGVTVDPSQKTKAIKIRTSGIDKY